MESGHRLWRRHRDYGMGCVPVHSIAVGSAAYLATLLCLRFSHIVRNRLQYHSLILNLFWGSRMERFKTRSEHKKLQSQNKTENKCNVLRISHPHQPTELSKFCFKLPAWLMLRASTRCHWFLKWLFALLFGSDDDFRQNEYNRTPSTAILQL
jgi:hypothetical protein